MLPLTVGSACGTGAHVDVLTQANAYLPPTAQSRDGVVRPLHHPPAVCHAAHFLLPVSLTPSSEVGRGRRRMWQSPVHLCLLWKGKPGT